MSKITSWVNALRGCVINWCEDQDEKKVMMMCADETLEYIDKLEEEQKYKLTAKEIETIMTCAKHNNNYCSIIGAHCSKTYYDEVHCCEAIKGVMKKLEKQKEIMQNGTGNE